MLLASAALTLGAVPGSAQAPGEERAVGVWLALGPGFGGGGGIESGVGGMFQLTGQWGPHRAALRLAGLADFAGFPDGGSDDSVNELGLTYGRSADRAFGYTAWAAGLSVVRLGGRGDSFYDSDLTTVGIPVTVEAGLRTRVVGVALQAFANLNAEASYAGLALNFLLGWIR